MNYGPFGMGNQAGEAIIHKDQETKSLASLLLD